MNKSQLKKIIGYRSTLVNTENWYGNSYAIMLKDFLQLEYQKIWSEWKYPLIDIKNGISPNRVLTEDSKVKSIVLLFNGAKEITVKDKHLYFRKSTEVYDLGIPLNEDGIAWVNHIYLEPVFENPNYKLFYNEKSKNFFLTFNTDTPTVDDVVYLFVGLNN
jgi:hypothetical protein